MGNCASSCLGQRRRDSNDDDEETRLLFDDPSRLHYGGFGEQQLVNGQQDPQEAQREIEALQRIVAQTSDNMVDIYEIAPRDKGSYAYAGREARVARYQNLISKLSVQDDNHLVASQSLDGDETDPDSGSGETRTNGSALHVQVEEPREPLVGTFADADAAMR